MVDWRCFDGWRLHGLWSIFCVLSNLTLKQRKSTALEPKFTAMKLPLVNSVQESFSSVEASAFLIATQLRKVFIQRFPVSFIIVGLGSLGAGYYGNKYYRAVLKGEHIRRFEGSK